MKTAPRIIALLTLLAAVSSLRAQAPAPTPQPAPSVEKETRIVITHSTDKAAEKIVYLGVETVPANAALTSQLNLESGTALLVKSIIPKSPAAEVLKENDLLLKMDDQVLIEPRQLAVLVRNHKQGDEVTLTYLRGGRQATAKVKLVQREMPKMVSMHGPGMTTGSMRMTMKSDDPQNRMEIDRVLSLMDDQNASGQKKHVHVERIENGPGMTTVTVVTNNSDLFYNDETGTLNLTIKDGKKTLEAKNTKGETVFSGSIDTTEQRKTLPSDVARRLEKIETMQDVRFETDGDFKGRDVKVIKTPATSTMAPLELVPLRSLVPNF